MGSSLTDHQIAQMTDEELMLRSKEDVEAFTVLTHRYGKKIYNFILRSVGQQAIAEDLYQDTFLKAFEARERYRVRGAFSSWLFTIARNLLADRSRMAGRGHLVSLDSRIRSRDSSPHTLIETLPDPTPGPEQAVLARQGAAWVREAMGRLPEGQREVLLLSRFHEMSYQQIAEIVENTPEAVKQMAYRAMLTLRAWYAGEAAEEASSHEGL